MILETIITALLLQQPLQMKKLDMNGDKKQDTITVKTFLDPIYDVRHPENKNNFTTRIKITDGADQERIVSYDFASTTQLQICIVSGLNKTMKYNRPGLNKYPTIYILDNYGRTETIQWNGKEYEHHIITYKKEK